MVIAEEVIVVQVYDERFVTPRKVPVDRKLINGLFRWIIRFYRLNKKIMFKIRRNNIQLCHSYIYPGNRENIINQGWATITNTLKIAMRA